MSKLYGTALILLAAIGSASAAQVADYRFNNTLQSTIAGAPGLTAIGPGSQFATETVFGQAQVVFKHSGMTGLELKPTTGILPNPGVYTIVMQVRHEVPDGTYVKYIDYAAGSEDRGLYDSAGFLDFFPFVHGPDPLIGTDYVEIAITRDASGTVAGYVDGMPQFTGDDAIDRVAVIDASNTLRFVFDDATTETETAPGAVARIRIWDVVLTADQIAGLANGTIFTSGFELLP